MKARVQEIRNINSLINSQQKLLPLNLTTSAYGLLEIKKSKGKYLYHIN